MPDDSYMLKYFSYLGKYLSVGPPVYFVVKPGLDLEGSVGDQNRWARHCYCHSHSLYFNNYKDPATAAAVADPQKNMEARERRGY